MNRQFDVYRLQEILKDHETYCANTEHGIACHLGLIEFIDSAITQAKLESQKQILDLEKMRDRPQEVDYEEETAKA